MIWASIITMALVTYLVRLAPFVLFGGSVKTPKWVEYAGKYLPPSVMGMLIVYSIKEVDFLAYQSSLPVALAMGATAILHLWKRNNLLSILGGTAVYMIMVQMIFK